MDHSLKILLRAAALEALWLVVLTIVGAKYLDSAPWLLGPLLALAVTGIPVAFHIAQTDNPT